MSSKSTSKKSPLVITDYFDHLLSSISPIVTIGAGNKIRFLNSSFLQEFNLQEQTVLGKNIFQVLKLSDRDKQDFKNNLEKAHVGTFVNSEFKLGGRVYGFSVFCFEEDMGIILKDITDKKKLESKVKKLHSELLKLQEKERQKLAAELHDGVGQTILAAKLNFIAYNNNPVECKEKFATGLALIDQVSQELREIYTNLYPSLLKDLGLEAAIRSFLKDLFKPRDTMVECQIKLPKMDDDLEVNLYRITQEIATNAAKHAKPKNLRFRLFAKGNEIILEAEDDGKGFSTVTAAGRGFGLENIKRRVDDFGGYVNIQTGKAKGTKYRISIPLRKDK